MPLAWLSWKECDWGVWIRNDQDPMYPLHLGEILKNWGILANSLNFCFYLVDKCWPVLFSILFLAWYYTFYSYIFQWKSGWSWFKFAPTNSHTDPLAQSATPYATLRHGHNSGPKESHDQPINDAAKEYVSIYLILQPHCGFWRDENASWASMRTVHEVWCHRLSRSKLWIYTERNVRVSQPLA